MPIPIGSNDFFTKSQSDSRYVRNRVFVYKETTRYPAHVMVYLGGVFWESKKDSDEYPNIGNDPLEANSEWWEEVASFDEGVYYTQNECDSRFLGIAETAVKANELASSPKINGVTFSGTEDIVIGVDAEDVSENINKVFVTVSQRDLLSDVEIRSNKNIANGYAGLNSLGKIDASHLPSLSTIEVYVVEDEEEMLLLSPGIGDQAVRLDLSVNNVFILTQLPASNLSNWIQLNISASVSSVNGNTGIVILDKTDIGLSNVDNTADIDKPVSTLMQALHNSHATSTSNPHSVTKAQVGLGNVDDTSDINKPISTATQTALNLKANSSEIYTKTETDAKFSVVYTKTETDGKLLGVNQTGNDFTGSRDFGVTYTNTTGKPIELRITVSVSSFGTSSAYAMLLTDSVERLRVGGRSDFTQYFPITLTIPNGSSYRLNNGGGCTIFKWGELR